ncbi:rCG62227 [Rattus norvegicus]|uniref:RCG62227 n=1 Tax=Rattus norvegicus TaxID=10116 RepID=A6HB90_RAT|nr:rCG62227 [Rattus norvegicus]
MQQLPVLKFAATTGATPDGFTPETFTNQIQATIREPQLQAVTVPRTDHQPLVEASFLKTPSLYPRNTDSPLCHMDIVISCNKGAHSMGQTRWTLIPGSSSHVCHCLQ